MDRRSALWRMAKVIFNRSLNFGYTPRPRTIKNLSSNLPKFCNLKPFRCVSLKQNQCVILPWDGLHTRDQGDIGSCVGAAAARCIDLVAKSQIKNGKKEEFLNEHSIEAIYALSRVEVGGGDIQGDGSLGIWAATAARDYGTLLMRYYGDNYDLSQYSVKRCREWGDSGLPDDLEPVAISHPVKTITLVDNLETARQVISLGYPILVCSDVGFNSDRDSDGFLIRNPSTPWYHAMTICGYRTDRRGFLITNSWGDTWHGDLSGPEGPYPIPPGSFWAEEEAVARMLKFSFYGETVSDSYAFSDYVGFPQKDVEINYILI